jgi:diguanylate cyclase (GGDEF)-like protein
LEQVVSVTSRENAKQIMTLIELLDKYERRNSQQIQKIISCEKQIAELTELTMTDQLTGLLSRHGMLSRFHGQINPRTKSKSQEASSEQVHFPKVSALFIDVDQFKRVNDTLGHNSGDDVLIALADIMQASFRTEDILCRLSGDEFLVILPRADIKHAFLRAEKFQQKLNADARMSPQGIRTTVSIGIAELDFGFSDADLALTEAMQSADTAMYRAKAKGRNMIVRLDD